MSYRWVDPISRFKSSPAHAVPDVHDTDIVTSLCGKMINLQFAVPAADGRRNCQVCEERMRDGR